VDEALPGVADAAVYLHGGLADVPGGARAVHLGDLGGADRLGGEQLVDAPGRVAQDAYRALDQGEALGQRMGHGLVRPDRLPVLRADLRVVPRQRVRTASRPHQVRRRDDQGQRQPAPGVRTGQLAGRLERAEDFGAAPGQVGAGEFGPDPAGQQPVPAQREHPLSSVGVHGFAVHGDRPGLAAAGGAALRMASAASAQIVGQHRAEEGDIDQPTPEFLGDEGDLHRGGPVGPQRSPAGRGDRLLQPRDAVGVAQVVDGAGAEVTGQPGGRVTQLPLLSG
jgi:hypothetical protein